jgi:hypothetical protein
LPKSPVIKLQENPKKVSNIVTQQQALDISKIPQKPSVPTDAVTTIAPSSNSTVTTSSMEKSLPEATVNGTQNEPTELNDNSLEYYVEGEYEPEANYEGSYSGYEPGNGFKKGLARIAAILLIAGLVAGVKYGINKWGKLKILISVVAIIGISILLLNWESVCYWIDDFPISKVFFTVATLFLIIIGIPLIKNVYTKK